jgi:hypothetical protein
MTEKEIQLLGFERHHEDGVKCEDDLGNTWTEDEFYYYTYTIARGFELISNSSDDTENGEWFVEFFETDPTIRFYDFAKTQALINLLEKHRV